jgi:hypothetical protein
MGKENTSIKIKVIIKNEFKKDSFDLVTRQTGQKIFQRLEKEIIKTASQQSIVLDFAGVGVIDYSCADEVIVKLISRLQTNEYGDKYILFSNLTPTQKDNIHVALERRNLAALELKKNDGGWGIIGALENYLLKTLEIIMAKGELSSSQLSDSLNLELNTASMRLINLYRLKLVKKTLDESTGTGRGRRHFVYRSIAT